MAEEVQAKKEAEARGEYDPNRMKGKWWRRLPNGGWQVNTTGEPEW